MTKLLVSVTDADEAIDAVANGADLIDVKNPKLGSLGAATPEVWRDVLEAVGQQVPVSAALGELIDDAALAHATVTTGLQFAKVGLANQGGRHDWEGRWIKWRESLGEKVTPVAVMYADWQDCGGVSPADVMWSLVMHQRCKLVLIDTFNKRQGTLLRVWNMETLTRLCATIRDSGSSIVLAGSLQLPDLTHLLPLQPDYVAVRGAVCRGDRTGRLDGALVREWASAVQEHR